ncbi:MAG TPA: TorF family putative porin [Steroidobacteraceae bacterium]|nr:TorF family putative porin [Steroidobacteraceae bacterium]
MHITEALASLRADRSEAAMMQSRNHKGSRRETPKELRMRGMKLIVLSLMLAAGTAGAQVTGTVTVTSDYDFRGFSQSAGDPAVQGSLDWADDSGIYAGVWGSNVDFGEGSESDVEIDLYAGFAGGDEEGLGYDFGVVYYSYWPDDDEVDYFEIFAGLTYNIAEIKGWYSDDYFGVGESAYYLEGNLNFELPQEFGLGLHLGMSDGDAFEDSVIDYGVSVSKSFSNFDFELKYVDTDLDSEDCETPDDVFTCEGRVILSVSTTFPWGAE